MALKSCLSRQKNHHSRSIISSQQHRLFEDSWGNTVNICLFINSIVSKHVEKDSIPNVLTKHFSYHWFNTHAPLLGCTQLNML